MPVQKQHIHTIVERLGGGVTTPAAYDTAWVARIPSLDDLNKPAYPQCLEWLRQNQLPDGSWGLAHPFYAHGNTVSTLAAVLAFAQWDYPDDRERIQRGVDSLTALGTYLHNEPHEGVAFELLIPAFQEEAAWRGLKIPSEPYKPYEKLGDLKRAKILQYERHTGGSKPRGWWFSLELIGGRYLFELNRDELSFTSQMLTPLGSVGASPSATAYLLTAARIRGIKIPTAHAYLDKLVYNNPNGIPHFAAIDITELIWGIDYFLKAGMSVNDPILKPALLKLMKMWNPTEGLGYTSHFIPDADDTAVALDILHKAGYAADPTVLMRYFNGEHITGYADERDPSVSVNIHALVTLRAFEGRPDVDFAIGKVVDYLSAAMNPIEAETVFDDKWHFSPFYSTSRAVFALTGLDDSLAQHCIDWILARQWPGGGWGNFDCPTLEETAHVVLALCFWQRRGHTLPAGVLRAANRYFESVPNLWPTDQLWISKTLYSPTLHVAATVAAARWALGTVFGL